MSEIFDNWITTREAARILGISQNRVRQLYRAGIIQGRLIHPKLLSVYKPDVEKYKSDPRRQKLRVIKVSEMTEKKLLELSAVLGLNQNDVISLAIESLHPLEFQETNADDTKS